MKTPKDYERMRQAKADKFQARASAAETVEVGRAVLSGPVFGGIHTVRILAVDDGRPLVDFELDGVLRGMRTARGAKSELARMLTKPVSKGAF